MANKIIVSVQGSLGNDALASKKQAAADQLGVCPEDIIVLTDGLSVSVVDIPDGMTKAREKADRQAEADTEKAQKGQDAAEAQAIAETADRLREQATEQRSTDARREVAEPTTAEKSQAKPVAETKPVPKAAPADAADYESWTAEDLHAEAARRDLSGRSGLAKADLVKLIQKADKDDEKSKAARGPAAGHGHAK